MEGFIITCIIAVIVIYYYNRGTQDKSKTIYRPSRQVKSYNSLASEIVDNSDRHKIDGYDFEKYCVSHFDMNYFSIKEWRGDKGVNGYYAKSNSNPDIEMQYNVDKTCFALECKFRGKRYDKIEFAKEYQIDNYKKFSLERKIPVFILLGLSGSPQNPNEVFIIPLKDIKSNIISYSELTKYRRFNNQKKFFFDPRQMVLK